MRNKHLCITVYGSMQDEEPLGFIDKIEVQVIVYSLEAHIVVNNKEEHSKELGDSISSLAGFRLKRRQSKIVYRQNFFGWKKRVACSYTEYLGEIEEHLDMWLHCVVPNGQEPNWRELLLRYRLDQQFPEEVAMHLADKNIVTAAESADRADEYLVQRKIYARTTSQRDTQNENLTLGQRWSGYSNSISTVCQRRGHVQSECYSDPKSPLYRGARRPSNQQMSANTEKVAPKSEHDHGAYCASVGGQSMVDQRHKKYTGDVYIAQKPSAHLYLRDTGSTLSFMSRDALPTRWSPQMTGTTVTVTGIHQSRGTYQLCKVPIVCDLYEGDLTVALTNRPPLPGVALVLGNDVDDETYEEDMSCGIATRRKVYDPLDPLNDGTLSGIFDEECRARRPQ
ncbi:hypothetical protein CAPTEDRAFT_199671 [Capitella teleta]|uniref:Uncharacterized protein n=1 Tax=Capitella teleta TaxID=283909 RepID=R7U9M7_CAPTE|nr:hypothetical protein CAPTEDRAFT_199671 [Capitella teleta]|eukprot:ELU02699.1 hypothetical protein CAPTEDRAFT_199671 [Capitella teleta]